MLRHGGYLELEDSNRGSPGWERNLFTLLIAVKSNRKIVREHLKSYQRAFGEAVRNRFGSSD